VRTDIAPGGTFPDYELTDHTKTRAQAERAAGEQPYGPRALARALLS
jgi:hypothetical protein